MALELARFLAGSLVILLPGIWLARSLSLGKNRLERWTLGSSIALAMAVYLAWAISHLDLRVFYPLWACVAVGCLVCRLRCRPARDEPAPGQVRFWMAVVLMLVAITRFGTVLPLQLPAGAFDPTFHLILARKIQIAQHAIDDWRPFENVSLNYPTGSHTLVVVLAALCGLPLQTVFKDFIALLGVLSTAQIYVLARRAAGNAGAALFAATAYGLWAWWGSINYANWGGLPNELAMLLFIAMLSLWLDDVPPVRRWPVMAILFAAMILVHHHVMVTGGIIIVAALICAWVRPVRMANASAKIILAAVVAALLLDAFFLVPYAAKIVTLSSTNVWHNGEPFLDFYDIFSGIGYVLCVFAAAGIALYFSRRVNCHPLLPIASATLLILFLAGEFLYPAILAWRHLPGWTLFTPSRFLTDLNYFLPIFAGMAIAYIQQKWPMALRSMVLLMMVASLAAFESWQQLATPRQLPDGFIQACTWIKRNTPPTTIVDSRENWTTYLAWRRADQTPMPDSEPLAQCHPQIERIAQIMSGQIPPDAPDQLIVAITNQQPYTGQKILWQDKTADLRVVQEWPLVQ